MHLRAYTLEQLLAAASTTVVGFLLGIDRRGRGAMVKLRCDIGDEFVVYLHPQSCLDLCHGISALAEEAGWRPDPKVRNDAPIMNPDDWVAVGKEMQESRIEAFALGHVIVWAIRPDAGPDRFVRIPAALALLFGQGMCENFRPLDQRGQMH